MFSSVDNLQDRIKAFEKYIFGSDQKEFSVENSLIMPLFLAHKTNRPVAPCLDSTFEFSRNTQG